MPKVRSASATACAGGVRNGALTCSLFLICAVRRSDTSDSSNLRAAGGHLDHRHAGVRDGEVAVLLEHRAKQLATGDDDVGTVLDAFECGRGEGAQELVVPSLEGGDDVLVRHAEAPHRPARDGTRFGAVDAHRPLDHRHVAFMHGEHGTAPAQRLRDHERRFQRTRHGNARHLARTVQPRVPVRADDGAVVPRILRLQDVADHPDVVEHAQEMRRQQRAGFFHPADGHAGAGRDDAMRIVGEHRFQRGPVRGAARHLARQADRPIQFHRMSLSWSRRWTG